MGNSGKCQMVVLRKKSAAIPQKQLDQEKENNMRLQHRISYLEEQVKELQNVKEQQQPAAAANNSGSSGHVTSISISSPPSTPPEKPLIFQRGNYITTLVGGKPIELLGDTTNNLNPNCIGKSSSKSTMLPKNNSAAHITKTLIRESAQNECHEQHTPLHSYMSSKSLSGSKISINSDSAYMMPTYKREKERHRERERERERYEKLASKTSVLQQRAQMQARSVEHLNYYNG